MRISLARIEKVAIKSDHFEDIRGNRGVKEIGLRSDVEDGDVQIVAPDAVIDIRDRQLGSIKAVIFVHMGY